MITKNRQLKSVRKFLHFYLLYKVKIIDNK